LFPVLRDFRHLINENRRFSRCIILFVLGTSLLFTTCKKFRIAFSNGVGILAVVLLFFSCTNSLKGQRYFSGRNEFGLTAGLSNYYGDLSSGSSFEFNAKHFHPSYGIFQKYNFSSYFSLRNQISFLEISGSSKEIPGLAYQNLNFKSKIYEFAPLVEFNLHPFGTNIRDGWVTPYVLTGLTFFRFNPTKIDNEDVRLRNLNTEGQKKSYSLFQASLPLGVGIKAMSPPERGKGSVIVGFEILWRKTFTDNLDDVNSEYGDYKTMKENQGLSSAENGHAQVSQGNPALASGTMRGDTHLKDWYYFIGFSLSYRFTPLICR
jgi:hypothetical protein